VGVEERFVVQPVTLDVAELTGLPLSYLDDLGYGTFRRLDDMMLWTVVAIWLATRRLSANWARMRQFRSLQSNWDNYRRGAMAVVSIFLCAAYVASAYVRGETFAWQPEDPHFWHQGSIAGVKLIQNIEGVIQCIVIIVAVRGLIHGFAAGLRAIRLLDAHRKSKIARRTVSSIFQACLTPFLSEFFFYTANSFPYILIAFLLALSIRKRNLRLSMPLLDKTIDWFDVQVTR
jgi:hypothetical protein